MDDAESDDLIVGRISGVYGVKGWVKIHSFTDPVENLLDYRDWKVCRRGRSETVEFDEARRHGKGLIAHIRGVDDRDGAAEFTGLEIAVPGSQLPALGTDEYYWHQLLGLKVYAMGVEQGGEEGAVQSVGRAPESTVANCLLGRVDQMMETGANDVLVVKPCEGSVDDRERLLPWIRGDVIKRVDLARGLIEVDWDPEF